MCGGVVGEGRQENGKIKAGQEGPKDCRHVELEWEGRKFERTNNGKRPGSLLVADEMTRSLWLLLTTSWLVDEVV